MRRLTVVLSVLAVAFAMGADPSADPSAAPNEVVVPTLETAPTPHAGDTADDAAIWRDPADPARSTIIGTDKAGSLLVYDSQTGEEIQRIDEGLFNNVDIRRGFPLGGRRVPLVVASRQDTTAPAIYRVDPATRGLVPVPGGWSTTLPNNYGACMYHDDDADKFYAIFNSEAGTGTDGGEVEQWELSDDGSGKVAGAKVRSFDVGGQTEGCVADDDAGRLYVGEEEKAVWRYGAAPGAGTARVAVDHTTAFGGRLAADVEGLALAGGRLIASSQGEDGFAVYDADTNAYEGRFSINAGGGIDGATDTDGIAATALPLGPEFPNGALVAQDGDNTDPAANANFKVVPYEAVFPAAPWPPVTGYVEEGAW